VSVVRPIRLPARRDATRITLKLIDSFALFCEGAEVAVPMSAQRVVAFITLQRRPVLRRYVAGSLWLDASEEQAQANLRSALWRLHRCGLQPVAVDDQKLRLADGVEVDFYAAEAAVRRALVGTPEDVVDIDPFGLAGDLLPDWYEDWALLERESHRQLRLLALDTVCERLLEAGRLSEALTAGLIAVAGDPLRESGQRAVVRAYLADGNKAEAIRQYRFFRRLLGDRLGLEPSDQMQELIGGLEATRQLLADRR
jgi:DNA-binding SARP family transcriptional activator